MTQIARIGVMCLLLTVVCIACCSERFTRPSVVITDTKVAFERLKQRRAKIQSFEYLTRISHYGEGGAQKGTVEILGKAKDTLRFEALTPTDDTLAVLVSNGKRFFSHERGKNACYVGRACAANVSRLLPMAFEGEDLFSVLTGSGVFIDHDSASLRWDNCEGAYRLTLKRAVDKTHLVALLRPDTFGPVHITVTRKGKTLFTLEYDDFRKVSGIVLPHEIRFESPLRDTDLSVKLRKIWLNKVDSDKPFEVVCPAGTMEKELKCQ